jgi:hypothetical protein
VVVMNNERIHESDHNSSSCPYVRMIVTRNLNANQQKFQCQSIRIHGSMLARADCFVYECHSFLNGRLPLKFSIYLISYTSKYIEKEQTASNNIEQTMIIAFHPFENTIVDAQSDGKAQL